MAPDRVFREGSVIINAPLIDENLLNRRGADYTTKRYSVIRLLCRRWNYTILANSDFPMLGMHNRAI